MQNHLISKKHFQLIFTLFPIFVIFFNDDNRKVISFIMATIFFIISFIPLINNLSLKILKIESCYFAQTAGMFLILVSPFISYNIIWFFIAFIIYNLLLSFKFVIFENKFEKYIAVYLRIKCLIISISTLICLHFVYISYQLYPLTIMYLFKK